MYKLKVNDQYDFEADPLSPELKIKDKVITWDDIQLQTGTQHILLNNKGYNVFVNEINRQAKTVTLKVNGSIYTVAIREPIDILLEGLGISMSASVKIEPMKAPMPGLVLKILVAPGQQVKKGDPVLILEAMKMENVFKAPQDAIVKHIAATVGKAVEKGEVLLEWE